MATDCVKQTSTRANPFDQGHNSGKLRGFRIQGQYEPRRLELPRL